MQVTPKIYGSKIVSIPYDNDVILATINGSTIHISRIMIDYSVQEIQSISLYGVSDISLMKVSGITSLAATVGMNKNGDSINDIIVCLIDL